MLKLRTEEEILAVIENFGVKMDEYNEVINHPDTYQGMAKIIRMFHNIMIGWTDERGSHFDILFVHNPVTPKENNRNFQGGLKSSDLFVSIMRKGSFGFEINNTDTTPEYYGEKLGLGGRNETTIKLAELINNIKVYLILED